MSTPSPAALPRIAFLLPNLEAGGTQRAQLLIARGAAEIGCAVDLFTVSARGAFAGEIPEGVRLVELGGRAGWDPRTVGALRHQLAASRPAALISALNEANLLAWRATRCLTPRPAVIMTVHNHFEAKWRHQPTPTAPLRRRLFRFLFRRADAVVTVSEGLRELVCGTLHLPPKAVHAIVNPIDFERLRTLSSAPVDHPWLRPERSVPVWLAAGRLAAQKDFPTLLHAFARLVAAPGPAPRLLILGDGPEEAALRQLQGQLALAGQVDYVGFQENPYAWMARADGFVLSSRWEGYPLVVLEARALGLPVVATDCPTGPAEMAASIGGIKLVAMGDPDALASALQPVPKRTPLADDSLAPFSCAAAARRYVELALRETP